MVFFLNTAVAQSRNPAQMASAMKLGMFKQGVLALAGRMEKYYAEASSPIR
jgi:thiazole synthase ThiGH ThiG subunit